MECEPEKRMISYFIDENFQKGGDPMSDIGTSYSVVVSLEIV
jgi:hypothetical protein